nr:hypothetical protein BSM_25820 [uncultured archaeon]
MLVYYSVCCPVLVPSEPETYPAGFWSKAYIITSEEADEVVANAMPVNSSVKVIPNNSPWFLVITSILICLAYN